MEIAVVAGFAAFLGKYLEQQFNLTTTSANQLLGKQEQTQGSWFHMQNLFFTSLKPFSVSLVWYSIIKVTSEY